jgi:hypothetical protein
VVVLEKKTGGVVQHDLPVLLIQGPEHGLVERLAARPARSGLERTLRPFTWFIPSGSGFLDRPRRIAGPAMLLWNTAHDAGGFRGTGHVRPSRHGSSSRVVICRASVRPLPACPSPGAARRVEDVPSFRGHGASPDAPPDLVRLPLTRHPTRRAYRPTTAPRAEEFNPTAKLFRGRPAGEQTDAAPAPDARRPTPAIRGCARGRHPRRRSPRQRGAPVVRATGSGWKRPEGAHPVSHRFEQACPGDAPENSAEPVGCLRRIRADGASPPTRRRSPSGRRGVRADRGLNPRRHRAQ